MDMPKDQVLVHMDAHGLKVLFSHGVRRLRSGAETRAASLNHCRILTSHKTWYLHRLSMHASHGIHTHTYILKYACYTKHGFRIYLECMHISWYPHIYIYILHMYLTYACYTSQDQTLSDFFATLNWYWTIEVQDGGPPAPLLAIEDAPPGEGAPATAVADVHPGAPAAAVADVHPGEEAAAVADVHPGEEAPAAAIADVHPGEEAPASTVASDGYEDTQVDSDDGASSDGPGLPEIEAPAKSPMLDAAARKRSHADAKPIGQKVVKMQKLHVFAEDKDPARDRIRAQLALRMDAIRTA